MGWGNAVHRIGFCQKKTTEATYCRNKGLCHSEILNRLEFMVVGNLCRTSWKKTELCGLLRAFFPRFCLDPDPSSIFQRLGPGPCDLWQSPPTPPGRSLDVWPGVMFRGRCPGILLIRLTEHVSAMKQGGNKEGVYWERVLCIHGAFQYTYERLEQR